MINVASYAKTKSSGNGGTGGGSYSSTINYYGKLSPHYLWGNLFDGSQDITGDIDASQADITAKNVIVKNELDAKVADIIKAYVDYLYAKDIENEGNLSVSGDTSLKNTTITGTLDLNGSESISGGLTVSGSTSISGGLTVSGDTSLKNTTVTDLFSNNITNNELIKTKDLLVTGSAHFFELIIDKIKAAGGAVILTPADGFSVDAVEEIEGGYRLYFRSDDENGNGIINMWKVNDQALCKSFNKAKVGTSYNVANKNYWTLVTGVDAEPVKAVCSDGLEHDCHFIDISTSVFEGTVDPEVGDEIVMLGYRGTDDHQRQSAIYISAYQSIDKGLVAPLFAEYRGINDFNLEKHRYSYIDANGATFIGTLKVTNGQTVEDYVSGQTTELKNEFKVDINGLTSRVSKMVNPNILPANSWTDQDNKDLFQKEDEEYVIGEPLSGSQETRIASNETKDFLAYPPVMYLNKGNYTMSVYATAKYKPIVYGAEKDNLDKLISTETMINKNDVWHGEKRSQTTFHAPIDGYYQIGIKMMDSSYSGDTPYIDYDDPDTPSSGDTPSTGDTPSINTIQTTVRYTINMDLIGVGMEVQGVTQITPEDYHGSVIYTTNNPEVATVDNNGKITTHSVGTAAITATVAESFYGGKHYLSSSDRLSLSVGTEIPTTTLFELDGEYDSFNVGDVIHTKVTVSPRMYDGNITYTSSDTSIATIDRNGVITILAEGVVTFKAKANELNKGTYKFLASEDELIIDVSIDDYLEGNKIIYKTIDNKPITLTDSEVCGKTIYQRFSANLVSNTYENGIGTLTFDRPITDINYGFYRYKTLQMVKLPTDLPTITQLGTSDGLETHLTDVYVGQNTRHLTGESFYLFNKLKNIHLDKDSKYYTVVNGALYTKNMDTLVFIPPQTGLETLVLDDRVRNIGKYALCDNTVVKKITAKNIDTLDCWFGFDGSYVEEVEFGGTATKVGEHAFNGAFNLSKIVLPPTITSIASTSFQNIQAPKCDIYLNCLPPTIIPKKEAFTSFWDTNEYIHVPKEYYYDYYIDDVWSKFYVVTDGVYEIYPSKFELVAYNTLLEEEDFCVGEDVTMKINIEPEIYANNWKGEDPISRDTSIVDEQGKCLADGTVELYCESYEHSFANRNIKLMPATATKTITVKPVKFVKLKDRFYKSGNVIHEKENVEDYGILKFTYTSSDERVATVDKNGVITIFKDGECHIRVTLNRQTVDGVVYKPQISPTSDENYYCDVDVKDHVYVDVTVENIPSEILLTNTHQLNVKVTPTEYKGWITYSSSNSDILKVDDNGKLTALRLGTATITIRVGDYITKYIHYFGKTITYDITVSEIRHSIEHFTIDVDGDRNNLRYGQMYPLNALVAPSEYRRRPIDYKSSNDQIVTVQNNKLRVNNKGTAKITGIIYPWREGYDYYERATAEMNVTVNGEINPEITSNLGNKYGVGDTVTINATVGFGGYDGNITYTSSDPSIATIENGVVTFKKIGDVTITISASTCTFGSFIVKPVTKTYTIIVRQKIQTSLVYEYKNALVIAGSEVDLQVGVSPSEYAGVVHLTLNDNSLGTLTVDDSKFPIKAHLKTSTENEGGLFVYAQADEYETNDCLFLATESEPIAFYENAIKPHVYMKLTRTSIDENNLRVGKTATYTIYFSTFDKNGAAFRKPDGYPDPKYPSGAVIVKDKNTGNYINEDSTWFKIELKQIGNGNTYDLICTAKEAGKTVDVYVGGVGYEDDYYIYHYMDNPTQIVRLKSIKA